MDIVVNDLQSTVEVGAEEALLDPAVMRRIVSAVGAHLQTQEAGRTWEARERSASPTMRGR
jgi:photosystem II stability/assembly factor-like uncharacterized protein